MSEFTEPIIHQPATIADSVMVGENCTIWQYATICEDAVLGESVVVGSHAWIGRGVRIGAFTRIQHGAFIPNHTQIGIGCFIGPNCSMTDDRYPKAGRLYRAEPPILEDDCSLGAHCVILPGVRIGRGAMVGAGAVVCADVAPFTIVSGCPARTHSPETEQHHGDFDPHA
jgi:UDP-2-acetamido-3-amino-2,3-dideoxy-glucuronate N-acetyltransferase